MTLIKQTTLHNQTGTSDKIYEVDLCDIGGNRYQVNMRYGRRGKTLKEGTKTPQPVSLPEAEKLFDKLVQSKRKEGYQDITTASPSTPEVTTPTTDNPRHQAILYCLLVKGTDKRRLNRAIWRAGELKIREATPLLLTLIGTGEPLQDYCIAAALGHCGDDRALPYLQQFCDAATTPEFVQRIAFEAWMKLADESTKQRLREQKIAQLPSPLREWVQQGNVEDLSVALTDYLDIYPTVKELEQQLERMNYWEWQDNQPLQAQTRSQIEQLPANVGSIVQTLFQQEPYYYNSAKRELTTFIETATSQQFAVLDTLYQIDNSTTRPVILNWVKTAPFTKGYFQRMRHIFKMAEYRHDAEVFCAISYRFDTEPPRHYRPYRSQTREYLRRRVWRTLRKLGEAGDANYVTMAVEVLLHYADTDAVGVKQSQFYRWINWSSHVVNQIDWDSYAGYVILNHILYENSPRYGLMPNNKAWRCREGYKPGDPEPVEREEAFPQLWEQQPEALLRLLLESNCRPVHQFAAKALRVCQEFCTKLDINSLIRLINQPYDITTQLGFELVRERYDPENPNIELVQALVNCSFAPGRIQAHQWIEARRDRFLTEGTLLLSLVISQYSDTRQFARQYFNRVRLGENTARLLVGRIIAELFGLAVESSNREEFNTLEFPEIPALVKDTGETLFLCFTPQLRHLGLGVIVDMLAHPLPELQEIGARLLLNHDIPAADLPADLIESLLTSPQELVREIGVQLLGKLPDERLRQSYDLLLAMATHELADLRQSIRPVIQRLADSHPEFATQVMTEIINLLLIKERHPGVHKDLITLLRKLPAWMSRMQRETVQKLWRTQSAAAQELAGVVIQGNPREWSSEFETAEMVKLASHEVLAVRQGAWAMVEQIVDRIRGNAQDKLAAVRLLEAKWQDSREFAGQFFEQNFTRDDWTPEVMISLCDSIRDDVRQVGRGLVIRYFQESDGDEYLLKFSEHPSADMQEFATNYLADYGADHPERLRELMPYFVTVLSGVNRGRVAKDRVFGFLDREAQKSEEAARIVAEVLTRQSLTIAIGDKARAIEIMVKIHQRYPQVKLPIRVKAVEPVKR